jgi:hypothetical protein
MRRASVDLRGFPFETMLQKHSLPIIVHQPFIPATIGKRLWKTA